MALAWLLALQAAAPSAPAVPADFDLATFRPTEPEAGRSPACGSGGGSEIVVCGRRRGGGDYPYEEMERRYQEKPLVAETTIGGGATARAYVESVAMPQGEISKRVMVGIKLPF